MSNTIMHRQQQYMLREMLDEDVDSLLQIEKIAHDYPWSQKNIESSLESNHHCIVLEHEQSLVAYAVSSTAADEAELLNIVIAKPYQNMGLGNVFLNYICQSFDTSIQMLFLEVRESNQAAIKLYQRLEFNEVGVRSRYYPSDSGREDAIIMAKSLL